MSDPAGILDDDQLVRLLDSGYVVVPVRCVSAQGMDSALRPGAPATPRAGDYPRGLLVEAACEAFDLTRAQITSTSSVRRWARPRHYAMHFGHRRIGYSTPELGQMFGRDHTTALYAIDRVQQLLADPATSWEAAGALQRLENAYTRRVAPPPLPEAGH